MHRKAALVALASCLLWPDPLRAQAPVDEAGLTAPLHVALAEAGATLTRHAESLELTDNEPLVDGDRVQSGPARLEIRSERGDRIFVDERTVVDVVDGSSLRLVRGRLRVEIGGSGSAWRIETSGGLARLDDVGSYSVVIIERPTREETELIVWRGSAALETSSGVLPLSTRQRGLMSAFGAPSGPVPADAMPADAFDRWVDQAVGAPTNTASRSYLPQELSSYSVTLEQSGSWSHEVDYGYVWYPTVSVGWRPYWRGWWRPTAYYGYVWVGPGAWTWPTHHYGRWEFGLRGWFWIPASVWRPAWVAWSVGPGYVGWCPLGWGNRPVVPFPHGGGRHGYYGVTPYRGAEHVRAGYGGYGPSDPWAAWNVVRADHFRSSRPVWRHAVDGRSLPTEQRSAFVVQGVPPRVQTARPLGSGGTRVLTAPRAPERAAARGAVAPGAARPVPRQGERTNTPATGRALQAGSSTATPRWTPPSVHYGIPPVERAEPPIGAGRDGPMAPTYRNSIPGLARPASPVDSAVVRGGGGASTRSPDSAAGIYRAPRPSSPERGLSTPSWGSAPRQAPAPARPPGGAGMAVPRGGAGSPHGAPAARGAAPSRGTGGAPPPAARGTAARPRSR